MKIKLCICSDTTATELLGIVALCNTLALGKDARVAVGPKLTAPLDEAELAEPEEVVIVAPEPELLGRKGRLAGEAAALAGETPVKRTRRTKAEIEAAAAAQEVTPEPAPLADQPAPTRPAPETEPAKTEPAAASPSDGVIPTPAELNVKASLVAKKIGPEKIRDHINSLGAQLISQLDPTGLISLNNWLDAQ